MEAARGPGSRRRGDQPVRRRGVSDHGVLRFARQGRDRAGQPHRGPDARDGAKRLWARSPHRPTAGSTPSWPRSSRSWACSGRVDARAGAVPRGAQPAEGADRPHHRREGRPHAPGPGALGLPGVLPPGGCRPRHRPHAGGADRRRAPAARRAAQPEPARRCADDRDDGRDGCPGDRLRRRLGRGGTGPASLATGRAPGGGGDHCRRARSSWPTRTAPSRCCSARSRRSAASPLAPGAWCSPPCA